MRPFLLVCGGGALGSGLRYLLALAAVRLVGPGVPLGTFAVNVAGSFAMGAVSFLASDGRLPAPASLALTVGVLGGFTTYSAFNQELLQRVLSGALGAAAGYAALTVGGCTLAGILGLWTARALAAG